MIKLIVLACSVAVAISCGGSSKGSDTPAAVANDPPAAAANPVEPTHYASDYKVGDRVTDPNRPGSSGTVTQVPDTGHHWFQSPLEVKWDDGEVSQWGEEEKVALEIVGQPAPATE